MTEDHDGESGADKRGFSRPKPQDSARRGHDIDEEAILREGREARRQLGRRMASAALNDPRIVTAKRLQRLGPEGLQRFVAELRRFGVEGGTQTSSNRSPSGGSKSAAKAVTSAKHPEAGTAAAIRGRHPSPRSSEPPRPNDAAAFRGWWLSSREGRFSFEAKAAFCGLLIGIVALLLCLCLLAQTQL